MTECVAGRPRQLRHNLWERLEVALARDEHIKISIVQEIERERHAPAVVPA